MYTAVKQLTTDIQLECVMEEHTTHQDAEVVIQSSGGADSVEVLRPQNVYVDLSRVGIDLQTWSGNKHPTFSETLDHVLTQENETFWGRKTSTGCPQPKD